MIAPRARRRTLPDALRPVAPVAAMALGVGLAGATFGEFAAVATTGLAWLGMSRWWRGERASLRADVLDVDAALMSTGRRLSCGASDEDKRLIQAASQSVTDSVRTTLDLVRASLGATSAVVLWHRSRAGTVQLRVAETSSQMLRTGEFGAREGLLGLIEGDATVAVSDVAARPALLPWYDDGHDIAFAVAAPILRDGIPVGVLVVDRARGGRPFDTIDQLAVRTAADQVALSVRLETLVLEATTAQRDIQALTAAAAELNGALTLDDVCSRALTLLRALAPIDEFVVTTFDAVADRHVVVFGEGEAAADWVGESHPVGDCLVSRVVRTRESLPFSGRGERAQVVIVGDLELGDARGLLVFPLLIGPSTLGTVTIANRHPDAFDGLSRSYVSLLTHQLAAALTNALAYGRMVAAATTDGMTGLTNHRTFKERAADALARAARSRRPVTLLLTDIDHFKQVNDTHGHPVGDEVIKAVARVLSRSARNVDIVARYGGEEFAVLLEEADVDAAVVIANRIREAVKALAFDGAHGPFSVSISLGAAQFDGGDLTALIDEADQALYAAKRAGRDRVCVAAPAVAAA